MNSTSRAPNRSRSLLAVLRRRWLIVVVIAVIVPAGAVLLAERSPSRFRSTAKVLISDRDLASVVAGVPEVGLDTQGRSLATEAQIAALPSVISQAKASLGDPSTEVAQDAEVSLKVATANSGSGESNILNVNADSTDRRYSEALASAAATEYVQFRRDLATREIRAARDDLARRITQLRRSGRIESALFTELSSRQQQLETLLILGSSRAKVLEGGAPAEQIAPEPVRAATLGLLAGLLLAVLTASLIDRMDRRVRANDEIGELLLSPILGTLPDPRRKDRKPSLVTRDAPSEAAAEAFRMLRTHVKFALAARQGRLVLVTSANSGEGKSYVSANLAISAASAGEDVILVDLDLRKPMAHSYLGVADVPGLSDVIAGSATLESALIEVRLPTVAAPSGRLRFLPAGHRVPNPGEFVASETVSSLLGQLRELGASLILVDTPPMMHVGDATSLAPSVDATAIVVRADSVSRKTLERLAGLLASGAHRPLGVVLTASWKRRVGYADGRYGSGYGHSETTGHPSRASGLAPLLIEERQA